MRGPGLLNGYRGYGHRDIQVKLLRAGGEHARAVLFLTSCSLLFIIPGLTLEGKQEHSTSMSPKKQYVEYLVSTPKNCTCTDLNRTRRDWHRDAPADRAKVVRPLQRSARSSCAENHDSGDSPCRASPQAGRTTSRPVWLRVGPPSAASVRRRADAERSGQRALLFALQRVWDRPGIPGWNVDLR